LIIGDPGAESIFDTPIYFRGAMTLHALRLEVGDQDFFRIVRRWTTTQAGGHVTTNEFIRLAERISGERLDELFGVWLFTPEKPAVLDTAAARAAGSVAVDELLERMGTGR
jgi:aminopeptidase N